MNRKLGLLVYQSCESNFPTAGSARFGHLQTQSARGGPARIRAGQESASSRPKWARFQAKDWIWAEFDLRDFVRAENPLKVKTVARVGRTGLQVGGARPQRISEGRTMGKYTFSHEWGRGARF